MSKPDCYKSTHASEINLPKDCEKILNSPNYHFNDFSKPRGYKSLNVSEIQPTQEDTILDRIKRIFF